jgi:lysozyme
MVKGLDISHHNYPFPWDRLSPDFKFAFAKATQGATYKDPYFNEYWQHLKSTTLLRGAYIFWDCRYTAQQHWDNIASLGIDFSKPGVLPLCLDLENQSTAELDQFVIHNSAQCIASITELLGLIKTNTGRKPMVYTYANFLKEYLSGHSWPDCYLWLADYDGTAPVSHWDFWQCSEHGTLSGDLKGGQLDIDLFNGTLQELQQLANIKNIA